MVLVSIPPGLWNRWNLGQPAVAAGERFLLPPNVRRAVAGSPTEDEASARRSPVAGGNAAAHSPLPDFLGTPQARVGGARREYGPLPSSTGLRWISGMEEVAPLTPAAMVGSEPALRKPRRSWPSREESWAAAAREGVNEGESAWSGSKGATMSPSGGRTRTHELTMGRTERGGGPAVVGRERGGAREESLAHKEGLVGTSGENGRRATAADNDNRNGNDGSNRLSSAGKSARKLGERSPQAATAASSPSSASPGAGSAGTPGASLPSRAMKRRPRAVIGMNSATGAAGIVGSPSVDTDRTRTTPPRPPPPPQLSPMAKRAGGKTANQREASPAASSLKTPGGQQQQQRAARRSSNSGSTTPSSASRGGAVSKRPRSRNNSWSSSPLLAALSPATKKGKSMLPGKENEPDGRARRVTDAAARRAHGDGRALSSAVEVEAGVEVEMEAAEQKSEGQGHNRVGERGWANRQPLISVDFGGEEEGTPVPADYRPPGLERDVLVEWSLSHLRKDEDVGMFARGAFGTFFFSRFFAGMRFFFLLKASTGMNVNVVRVISLGQFITVPRFSWCLGRYSTVRCVSHLVGWTFYVFSPRKKSQRSTPVTSECPPPIFFSVYHLSVPALQEMTPKAVVEYSFGFVRSFVETLM